MIALAILGVIATFAIPKVLQAQQSAQFTATTKEAMATISAAYAAYKLNNTPTAATDPADLMPYLNYVKNETNSLINSKPGGSTEPCNGSAPCLRLHNGGVLMIGSWCSFGGTANDNGITFFFDPDGKVTSGSNQYSIQIWLYYNGRLSTNANGIKPTQTSCGPINSVGVNGSDPSWFSWN